jgi:DedD protein
MDSRAKQRLTGAVILVALFVLLVPELLTGPKTSNGHGAPAEEGLRRYTIDLNATSPGSTVVSPAEVTLPPVASAPLNPDRAQPGEPAMAPPATPDSEIEDPGTSGPSQPEPASVARAAPTQAAPAPAPAARSAPARPPVTAAAPPVPQGSFVVQLGSFGSRDNADRLVRDMNAKGFNTFIAPITTNGRELYRVRVGPTRDRASAEALAARLKRAGQSGSIVPIT